MLSVFQALSSQPPSQHPTVCTEQDPTRSAALYDVPLLRPPPDPLDSTLQEQVCGRGAALSVLCCVCAL